jgi:hypothetical protein
MWFDFEAGNKAYKLRLNTRNTVMLEKAIGCNPLAIFGDGENIPSVNVMVNILYASLQQYNHGLTLNDAYDIFDQWISEDHTVTDFLWIIIEIYKVSGLIKNTVEEKN